MKHVLRLNVLHDGKSYPKGSVCPASLVKTFTQQGLLETGAEDQKTDVMSLGEPAHAGSEANILPEVMEAEEVEAPKAPKKKAK